MRHRPQYPSNSLPTVPSLRRSRRQLDRRRHSADRVIFEMRRGRTLLLQYERGREVWRLSNGAAVEPAIAAIIACRPDVVPAGDALFPGAPSQTWRFVQSREGAR